MATFNQAFGLWERQRRERITSPFTTDMFQKKKKKVPVSNLSVIQPDFKIQDLGVGGIKYILNPHFLSPAR